MTARALLSAVAILPVLAAGVSCVSLDYDLAEVPVPVSARPADPGAAAVEPFTIETRNVLWAAGLFGRSEPDVAALVTARARGYDRVASFRVRQESGFQHWLLAHLSLTLVRSRRVVIEGELVRDAGS